MTTSHPFYCPSTCHLRASEVSHLSRIQVCSFDHVPKKKILDMPVILPGPLNSSPKLPETPLSPLLLPPTDPSQIFSPTCTILPCIRSNTTRKPHFSAPNELPCLHPQGSKIQFCLCYREALNYSEFIYNVGSLFVTCHK